MKNNYDFSDSIQIPYSKRLKKQSAIRLDENTIAYFKGLADDKGIPYQSLINMYLRDCAENHRKLSTKWT